MSRDSIGWVVLGLFAVALVALAIFAMDSDWAKALLSGGAGGLLALVAEQGSSWLRRPKLKLSFSGEEDSLTETPLVRPATGATVGKAIYLRAKVENTGELLARSCRAYLVKVESLHDDGQAEPTIYADSLPLHWSSRPAVAGGEAIDLPRGLAQYVNILAVGIDTTLPAPDARYWAMQFAVPVPIRYGELFSGRPSKLRFTIQVAGDGVAPELMSIDVSIGNHWDDVTASTAN